MKKEEHIPIATPTIEDVKRFLSFRWISGEDEDDCHYWMGGKAKDGYGHFWFNGRTIKAHRFAFFIHTGIDPGELLILHSCDHPDCINPFHLFDGTNEDNMRDKMEKGRHVIVLGESHGRSKLTESDILEIRNLNKEGYSKKTIAKEFGVKERLIYRIVKKELWKHI